MRGRRCRTRPPRGSRSALGLLGEGRVVAVDYAVDDRRARRTPVAGVAAHLPGQRPRRALPARPGVPGHHRRGGRRPTARDPHPWRRQAELLRRWGIDELVAEGKRGLARAGVDARRGGRADAEPDRRGRSAARARPVSADSRSSSGSSQRMVQVRRGNDDEVVSGTTPRCWRSVWRTDFPLIPSTGGGVYGAADAGSAHRTTGTVGPSPASSWKTRLGR